MTSISFTILSFIFCLILMIVYFTKDRIDYVENKVYSFIVVTSFVSCLVEIITFCQVQMGVSPTDSMYHFTMKLLFLCFLAWMYLFTLYTVITGRKLRGVLVKNKIPIKKITGVFVLIVLVILFLPIQILETNGLLLPVGLSVNLIYLLAGVCILTMIISILLNRKNLNSPKYVPLYLLIVLFTVAVAVQNLFPELFVINTVFSIIGFSMYFTIENPDMKMVEELIENRKIIERTSEEKSIFLFKMSQGLREPVNNINKQLELYKNNKLTKKEFDIIIDNIDKNNKKINYLISDVLGIHSFDKQSIKNIENTYNIYSLLEDVKRRGMSNLNDGVDYRFDIMENMPKELYGDSIKLKQILLAVLMNSVNNTQSGFINVEVNSFTKYDICRLIITIEDSSSGMDIVSLNDILEQELELTEQDFFRIEKQDIDLALSYKLIKILGGTMYIKSDKNKGMETIITLDQSIVMNDEEDFNNKVDSYIRTRNNKKKVLLVDDEDDEIRRIRNNLSSKGYEVVISMYGEDCIERIKNKEKFDVVIIDDEMSSMNGINVLEEIIKLNNKSRKIVLLNDDKLFIAKHYLKDGFDDYMKKSDIINELNEKM